MFKFTFLLKLFGAIPKNREKYCKIESPFLANSPTSERSSTAKNRFHGNKRQKLLLLQLSSRFFTCQVSRVNFPDS